MNNDTLRGISSLQAWRDWPNCTKGAKREPFSCSMAPAVHVTVMLDRDKPFIFNREPHGAAGK